MIIALIAALVAVNVAYLWQRDRSEKRHTTAIDRLTGMLEREASAYRDAYRDALQETLDAIKAERDAQRDEVQQLCQRIQAPEYAVVEHAQRQAQADENPYPLSEEEQVQAQDARVAAIAAIEAMERDGLEALLNGEGQ